LTDPDCFLRTDHVAADLKRTAVRGGTITITAQGLKFLLSIGATMALARLLTPGDFGLVAMVAAFTGFVAVFKDLGLAMATVQRPSIDHRQVSTLFWLNLLISAAVMVSVAALAPAVAWFYKEPRLLGVTLALGATFLFGGLTVQHHALLRRQMRFGALAGIEIGALLAGAAAAVVLALAGAGYWALVLRPIAVAAATAAGVWILCGWRPGHPTRGSGVRAMLAFGGNLTGFSLVDYFSRNLDNVLIGWRWREQQLGFYSRAYQLLLLPLQQINAPLASVAIPTLSRLQDDPARYRRYYCNAMSLLAYVATPFIVGMIVLSDEVIAIVLGNQWMEAGRLFRVLAIAALGQPAAAANGWVYISLGRARRLLAWGLISMPIFAAGFVVGLRWGALGVAAAYAICALALRVPGWLFAFHGSPIRLRDLAAATWRPTAISVALLGAMAAVRAAVAGEALLVRLVLPAATGIVTLVLLILMWPQARGDVARLLDTARALRSEPYRAEPGAAHERAAR